MIICEFCGPYERKPGQSIEGCPNCGLDRGEVKMVQAVIKYGFAECLRREIANEEL